MPTLVNPINGQNDHFSWNQIKDSPEIFENYLNSPWNNGILQFLQMEDPITFGDVGGPMPTKKVTATTAKTVGKPIGPLEAPKGFTFGADPELFIKAPDGKIICADMIPGTKDSPHKVEFGAVQRDGFAAEYNIDPCDNFEDWNKRHKAVQGQLQSMLPKGCTLVALPSHRFSPEVFDAAPDSAKELGCSPDWNAWEATVNPPAYADPDDPYLRCTGGHIHVGWKQDGDDDFDVQDIQHMLNGFDLAKQMDWYLGAWALQHDKDQDRRRLYGRAGACRIKPYGMEYRVLSSFWVLDKALRQEVWNRAVKAVQMMSTAFLPDSQPSGYNQLIQNSINAGKLSSDLSRQYSNIILKLAA